MPTVLETSLGPVAWVPRDFTKMPRNYKSTIPVVASKLRGVTVHYTGSKLAARYRNTPVAVADELLVADTIRGHCARTPPISDVGYQILIGRSGIVWEGRGVCYRNAANGPLRASVKSQYPAGATTSNPYWQSMMLCVGTDGEYALPTDAQWEAARRMVAFNVDLFSIANPQVNGHKDVRATQCPGVCVHTHLSELLS